MIEKNPHQPNKLWGPCPLRIRKEIYSVFNYCGVQFVGNSFRSTKKECADQIFSTLRNLVMLEIEKIEFGMDKRMEDISNLEKGYLISLIKQDILGAEGEIRMWSRNTKDKDDREEQRSYTETIARCRIRVKWSKRLLAKIRRYAGRNVG